MKQHMGPKVSRGVQALGNAQFGLISDSFLLELALEQRVLDGDTRKQIQATNGVK